MIDAKTFQKLNNKAHKTFVYQFGFGRGFGAEVTWLVTHIIKCLQFDIKFCLGRNNIDRGFSIKKGWEDYFEGFFPVVSIPLIEYLNLPQLPFSGKCPLVKFFARKWLKTFSSDPVDLFMFDDIGKLREVNLPEFGGKINFWEASRQVLHILWKYQPNIADSIGSYRKNISLSHDYSAVHIRRGDKITEAAYVSIPNYVQTINYFLPRGNDLIIFGDDPKFVKILGKSLENNYHVETNNTGFTGGYDQFRFNDLPAEIRYKEIQKFLAEIEIMKNADLFFGTMSSNVGILVKMLRGDRNCHPVKNELHGS